MNKQMNTLTLTTVSLLDALFRCGFLAILYEEAFHPPI